MAAFTILLAEDDEDDRLLVRMALEASRWYGDLRCVHDGQELMDYLHHAGRFQGVEAPRPNLILLDLNMPRKDGREALREIKADPALRRIPVVMLTTSRAPSDILATYDLGVNSYITKPASYEDLVKVMNTLSFYWQDTVQLPT